MALTLILLTLISPFTANFNTICILNIKYILVMIRILKMSHYDKLLLKIERRMCGSY